MHLDSDIDNITDKKTAKAISLNIDDMDSDMAYSSNGTHVILDVWG